MNTNTSGNNANELIDKLKYNDEYSLYTAFKIRIEEQRKKSFDDSTHRAKVT